ACDGGPMSASVATARRATASPLMADVPRRPVKAAAIIMTRPPIARMISGRSGAKRDISGALHDLAHRRLAVWLQGASGANPLPAQPTRRESGYAPRHCGWGG